MYVSLYQLIAMTPIHSVIDVVGDPIGVVRLEAAEIQVHQLIWALRLKVEPVLIVFPVEGKGHVIAVWQLCSRGIAVVELVVIGRHNLIPQPQVLGHISRAAVRLDPDIVGSRLVHLIGERGIPGKIGHAVQRGQTAAAARQLRLVVEIRGDSRHRIVKAEEHQPDGLPRHRRGDLKPVLVVLAAEVVVDAHVLGQLIGVLPAVVVLVVIPVQQGNRERARALRHITCRPGSKQEVIDPRVIGLPAVGPLTVKGPDAPKAVAGGRPLLFQGRLIV